MPRNLRDRQESLYRQFPSVIHLNLDNPKELCRDMRSWFARSLVKLEHLQNLLHINRQLLKANTINLEDKDAAMRQLVEVGSAILEVVLALWAMGTNRPHQLQVNFDWFIVSYACPAAEILCGELVRADSILQRPNGLLRPRRSDVVHQLSLFSGFLTWQGPDAPNASLWMTVKETIHRVLDQILNPPPPQHLAEGMVPTTGFEPYIMSDIYELFPFQVPDFVGWLYPE